VNASVAVFLNEAATAIRPQLKFRGTNGGSAKVRVHAALEGVPRSTTISEIQQAIVHAHETADVTISEGIDIYCTANSARPAEFDWFRGILRDALACLPDITVRLHCFGVLSDEQDEISQWRRVAALFHEFRGGAYLLSRRFREIKLDRVRTYGVLASIVELFASTGKSRFAPYSSFSVRRESSPFQVYVAGVESFTAPAHEKTAEWLFDTQLFARLSAALPLNRPPEWNPDPRTVEHWLLRAAGCSYSFAEMVETLRRWGGTEPLAYDLSLEVQKAITNAPSSPPAASPRHVLETAVNTYEAPTVISAARGATESLFRAFPFPMHPLFLRAHRQALMTATIDRLRRGQCEMLAELLRKTFYTEAQRIHRSWFPPNSSTDADAATAAAAFDVRAPGRMVFSTCHLDPTVSEDEREELCAGAERIRFLYLIPVIFA